MYVLLLFVAFQKIYSGFIMQFIFLIDAFENHPQNLLNLIFSWTFFINVSAGILFIILFLKVVKAMIKSFLSYLITKKFISKLVVKSESQYLSFVSNDVLVFTAGFFKPRIYVSEFLISNTSPSEFKAIILHEQKHQQNYDPLKDFIVNLINKSLLNFPGKVWVFENYTALVELSCDEYAQTILKTKLPLISALLKIQETKLQYSYCFNQFSSQNERIKILTDQKKPVFNGLFTFYSLMALVLLTGSVYLRQSDIFYQCNHLMQCFEAVLSPKQKTSNSSFSNINLSDHCQIN
jgi:hypothetical protein